MKLISGYGTFIAQCKYFIAFSSCHESSPILRPLVRENRQKETSKTLQIAPVSHVGPNQSTAFYFRQEKKKATKRIGRFANQKIECHGSSSKSRPFLARGSKQKKN
jgi:hypothetical protein